ncbi:MAG: lipid II:glycine glycyltransferase FemX [Clostridiales bacterium]
MLSKSREYRIQKTGNSSQYSIEIDEVDQNAWSEYLELFDDANIYQTWAYGKYSLGGKNLSHIVIKCSGNVIALSQARIVSLPFIHRGIAYIFWGPVWKIKNAYYDTNILQFSLKAIYEEYVIRRKLEVRIVSGLSFDYENILDRIFKNCGFSNYYKYKVQHTIMLDLERSFEEICNGFKLKLKRKIKRAESMTLEVISGSEEELLVTFQHLYKQLLDLKKISFPEDISKYILIQRDMPEKQKMQVFICYSGGEAVAGLLISFLGNSALLLSAAANQTGRNLNASSLLLLKAIKWLKLNGCKCFDLGGIDPSENPGGYRFKSQFGGSEIRFLGQYESCRNKSSRIITYIGEIFRRKK